MPSSITKALVAVCLSACGIVPVIASEATPPQRSYYTESTWKPRAVLPAADALRGDFWPASPAVKVDYNDPGFDATRLGTLPAPGVHPRVLVTPADVDVIRQRLALGAQAPAPFRTMWERTAKSRSAFYALVTKDDTLGRQLAAELVHKLNTLQPKLEILDRQADRDVLWAAERSMVASGDPNPPTEIWALLDYDYLHGWMSPAERELARKTIVRLTANRVSNFMEVPDHFMINNHQGFGMEYLRLLLLIEGEAGFDQHVFDAAAKKARAMLDWYLDEDGMCYESIKGWLNVSAYVALGRRQADLLKHSHLRAKMRFFQAAVRWEDGQWHIRDEMRASAFHVIWMMHYLHPREEGIDFLYTASLTTHPFLTDASARWPDPVGISPELLLLFANEDAKPAEWTDQKRIDSLHLPITWQDNARGYVDSRNSWRKEDLHLGFTCKQDFFYGGHEGSENNRIVLWKDGVNWIRDVHMLATKATFLQNMLTVDGKGLHWPPVPGVWLGTRETPTGTVAAGDGRNGYSYSKCMQVHPLDFPSTKLPYYAPFAEGNYDLSRDLQIAFHPGTVRWNDGYAHTDYGPWSGETRLVESYRSWNPMEQAYRTVHLARGEFPYVLTLDDARKDDRQHLFEWNITLPDNAELIEAKTPEIVFQNTEPAPITQGDLLLGLAGTPRDSKTGLPKPRKGDPLCLVRVLWRNASYGFPVPRFEKYEGFVHLTIPAVTVSPEFRILVYPHRAGDPLPVTAWNADRTELTVTIKNQRDVYRFGQTDGGRTVFAMERGGKEALQSDAPPARPVFEVRGHRLDVNDARTTRLEGVPPEFRFGNQITAALVRPSAPAFICYTLDGSEPVESSARYEKPLNLSRSCELKARLFNPRWNCGPRQSEIATARFVAVESAKGTADAPDGAQLGLLARVYEKKTVLWNDRGFFDAARIMMPQLDRETPLVTASVSGFYLPHAVPARPPTEQCKAFYRFTGWFHAEAPGDYEFAVDSCGPITLDVGGQAAIEWTGVFHQQQAVRRGVAVLKRGWHPVDLTVCDPLFWNIATTDPMPFSVTVRRGADDSQVVDPELLCFTLGNQALTPTPPMVWHPAGSPGWLEPGVTLSVYDRDGKHRESDYLDVDRLTPLRQGTAAVIETNLKPGLVRRYDGWFQAPMDGVYTFDLPARRGESAGLGELRAAYQSQLRVDGEVVVQRGIAGRFPTRRTGLKAGWHALSLRLGASIAGGSITFPDGQSLPLNADLLSRPVRVSIQPDAGGHAEIFGPSQVTMTLPPGRKAQIRYTLDGREPKNPVYSGSLMISKSAVLSAVAFEDGHAITEPAQVRFSRVDVPEADLLGSLRFDRWDGKPGPADLKAGVDVWVAPGAISAPGRKGRAIALNRTAPGNEKHPAAVDVNLTHGAGLGGFKVTGLRMKDNAISVGLWFFSDDAKGKLFGKDGYNAFGKSYKTVSCALQGGQLRAGPGRVTGGKVKAGTWQHVVLTADGNALVLYLNGERIADGPGTPTLTTDALDFFSDHSGIVERVRIYNRVLPSEAIARWYAWEQSHPGK